MGITRIFRQPFSQPQLPNVSFSGQTIVVTGANVGLGQHAAAQFLKMGASRIIATCRSSSKAETTESDIEALAGSLSNPGVVEAWELDYGSYASVRAFCSRISKLERLDAVVLNAGIATRNYELLEGDESSITINVISTTLLAVLLIPVLRRSAERFNTENTLSVTCSEIHTMAEFPERDEKVIFQAMSDKSTKTMAERYQSTKLLQLFAIRAFANEVHDSKPLVMVNLISPGLNNTFLTRNSTGVEYLIMKVLVWLVAWEPEVGARTLVHAVTAGKKSHGIMLDHCQIESDALAPWIETAEGKRIQEKVWAELEEKLENISPGCMAAATGSSA